MRQRKNEVIKRLIKIQYVLLLVFVITMTLNIPLYFTNAKLNNMVMITLIVNTIIIVVLSGKHKALGFDKIIIVFVSLYILFVAGLLHTQLRGEAIAGLVEKKIGLLVFPIILFYSPPLTNIQRKNILLSFVIGCVVTILFCLATALKIYIETGNPGFFAYHELSLLAGLHAIYFAMYFCLSIVFLIYLLITGKEKLTGRVRIFYYALVSICCISVFLLSARTHIAILIVGLIIFIAYRFSRRGSVLVSVLKAVFIGVGIVAIVFMFPNNRERFKQAVNYKGQYGIDRQWGEQQMRPLIWDCAISLIKKSPFIGVGTGDVISELHQCYSEKNHSTLLYFIKDGVRFNAHNQYLEVALALGTPALFIFIFSLIISIKQAVKNRNAVYLIFLVIFAISCLTESILERHNGVVFFSFFNSFLYFYNLNQFKESSN